MRLGGPGADMDATEKRKFQNPIPNLMGFV
jgi:hypothetical protein